MRLLKIVLVGLLVVGGLSCPAWAAVSQSVQAAIDTANAAISNNDPTLAAGALKGVLAADMTEEDRAAVEAALAVWYDNCDVKVSDVERMGCLSSLQSVGDQMKALGLAVNENYTTPPSTTISGGPAQAGNPPGASVGSGGGGGKTPAASPK